MNVCTVNTTNEILNVCNQVDGRDRFAYNPRTGKRVERLLVELPYFPDWEDDEMLRWLKIHERLANSKGIFLKYSIKDLSKSMIRIGSHE